MDEKFDELLNKNCSWSYRSKQVTRKSSTMKTYPDSVQIQQSGFTAVLQQMSEKVLTEDKSLDEDELDAISSENELVKCTKNTHNQRSKLQEEIRLLRKRPKPKSVIIPRATSTPIFGKTLWKKKIRTKSNRNSSSSSSEEEIFQTRLSVKMKDDLYGKEQDSNQNVPISLTEQSEKESTVENTSNIMNNFPIIIQAIPSDKNNAETHSDKTKENSKIKQSEINNDLEKSEMESTANEDIQSLKANDVENTVENDNFELKVKGKKSNENKERKKPFQEFMEKITSVSEKDSLEYEESIEKASDNFIIQDFLNGSLDLNMYRLDRQPSTNTPDFKNNKSNRISSKYFDGRNMKQKNNYFDSPPLDISNKSLKRKQTGKEKVKNTKKPRITANKRKAKTVSKKSEDSTDFLFDSKLENIFSGKIRQKNKNKQLLKHEDLASLNTFKSQKEAASSKNRLRNNKTKRVAEDKEVLNSKLYNKNLAQRSRRSKRNSSLIAKRKIKETEQLEHSESFEDMCFDFEDETQELKLDNVNTKAGKQNLRSEKRNKYQYQTESILSSDSFDHNINSEKINCDKNLEIYTKKENKVEKTQFSKNNTKVDVIRNTFYNCKLGGKSPLKRNNKRAEEELTENPFPKSDLILSEDNFIQKDENTLKRRKMDKRDHSKEKETIYSTKSTENENASKNEIQSALTYKGCMTRRRRRTWDMLEKELLSELDNEIPLTNNISEAVILKMENLVKKQNSQNASLHTTSNTTLKTIRKPTMRSKYNKQYKMNTESQYLEPKVSKRKYSNEFTNEQSKEIVPSCSANILERTIAAMESCTANLAIPKVTSYEYEEGENVLQFENISHYSNTSHEALIHSNVTFMANESERYYKNETVSYLKKYTRRESIHSNRNESENLDDAEHLDVNSFDAEHLLENSLETKHYLLKNNAEKINERSQAVVPFLEEKNNPWNNLIKKLHLDEDDTGGCLKTISNYEKNTQPISRPPIQGNDKLDEYPKRKHGMNLKKQIYKQKEKTDTENEQNFELMENGETELFLNVFKCRDRVDNLSLNTGSRNGSGQKKILESESAEINLEKFERKMEKNERKVTKLQTVKKSPKFKLQVIKNGNLKLKRHSSRSSSTSNSSVKKILKAKKIHSSMPLRNNTAKENYQKYLKKKITLIAEKEDDVFSLSSSSDSEGCNQENRGTGLLCELFEE